MQFCLLDLFFQKIVVGFFHKLGARSLNFFKSKLI